MATPKSTPPILLLLLLLFFAAGGVGGDAAVRQGRSLQLFQYQCPQGCFCVPDVVETDQLLITCKWTTIGDRLKGESFPRNVTKTLSIHCSQQEEDKVATADFPPNTFTGFGALTELRISGCQSIRLAEGMFAGLPKLRSLQLNRIGAAGELHLNQNAFNELPQLEKLTLSECALREIPAGLFCSMRFLQIVNVSHNHLEDARLGVHSPSSDCLLDHLVILDMSHNHIAYLADDLRPFPSLRQLSLASNQLGALDEDAFRTTAHLQHLNLANNHLPSIPTCVTQLKELIHLNLQGNSIEAVEPLKSPLSGPIEHLDLGSNHFSQLPMHLFSTAHNTLTHLSLAGNRIDNVEPFALQNFTRLKELDLSSNAFTSLPFGVFNGLHSLVSLHLNNNSIQHVDVEVFRELGKRLQTLSLANNLLTEMPMAIGRLSRIKRMDFSHNQIRTLYKFVLNKLAHLSHLSLSNNQLSSIDSYEFSDCAHLAELSLSSNRIASISEDAFDKCPRLRRLDLSSNAITQLNGSLLGLKALRICNISGNALVALQWEELPDEVLELFAANNHIQRLTTAAGHSEARRVDLQHNQLTALSSDQLPALLEELNVSHNSLYHLPKSTFADKSHLRLLDVRHNHIQTLPEGLFEQSVTVNADFPGRLYIEGNPVDCNCEMEWAVHQLTNNASVVVIGDTEATMCTNVRTGQRRPLSTFTSPEDFLCPYQVICDPTCVCCDYPTCDCRSTCPPGCDCFRDSHHRINVVRCEESQGGVKLQQLPMHATHIYLSGLHLPELPSHSFLGRTRLLQLHINASGIERIHPLAFNTLPRLRILNLSHNKLQRINGDEAFKTNRLHLLNLQQNSIKEVDARLAEIMPNLETLLLADNALEVLPGYLSSVGSGSNRKVKSISLGGNPLRCDCSSSGGGGRSRDLRAQQWFMANREVLVDEQNVICAENLTHALLQNDTSILSSFAANAGPDLFTMPMEEFLREENRSICVAHPQGIFGTSPSHNTLLVAALIVCTLLAVGALLCMVVGAVERRRRGRGSGKRLECVGNRGRYSKALSNDSGCSAHTDLLIAPVVGAGRGKVIRHYPHQHPYNIFVSYSKQDEQWVAGVLCEHLKGYNVGLLHRDASQYYNAQIHSISDGLNHLLASSDTLIIFVTRHFLHNEWTKTEIRSSHQLLRSGGAGAKTQIAIIDDDVNTSRLDNELGFILRQSTCVRRSHPFLWEIVLKILHTSCSPSGDSIGGEEADGEGEGSVGYSDLYGSVDDSGGHQQVPSNVV